MYTATNPTSKLSQYTKFHTSKLSILNALPPVVYYRPALHQALGRKIQVGLLQVTSSLLWKETGDQMMQMVAGQPVAVVGHHVPHSPVLAGCGGAAAAVLGGTAGGVFHTPVGAAADPNVITYP